MTPAVQTSLRQALDFPVLTSAETVIELSDHICFGSSAVGGYIAAALQKIALLYASQHPVLSKQSDVRFATTLFYRPVFPAKGALKVRISELCVGKLWSFLRAELLEGHGGDGSAKVCAHTDLNLTNFSISGITLGTHWQLSPAPVKVDLVALERNLGDVTQWACYHTPFYPDGFRRGHAYVKYFFPTTYTPFQSYVEHWIQPGWDCHPLGSQNLSLPEARWTNDMLPYVADMNMPVQENYFPHDASGSRPLPMGSVASTLQFAHAQQQARLAGKETWRDLSCPEDGPRGVLKSDGSPPDGFKAFMARQNTLNSTISMTIEFKKRLPEEGVRWLYLRGEVKQVQDGRQDWQVLCFDESMDLVFIRNGVEQILDPSSKNQKTKRRGDGRASSTKPSL